MEDGHDSNLTRKIERLSASREYENPRVSPEGYGSFVPSRDASHDSSESLRARAKLLKSEADAMNSRDAVPIYLESLFCYLQVQAQIGKHDMKACLNMVKFIIKFAEHIHSQAKKHDCEKTAEALEWALFNLKLFKLVKDVDFLPKNIDTGLYCYVVDVIKGLGVYYDAKSPDSIEIVPIEKLESGIKRRI